MNFLKKPNLIEGRNKVLSKSLVLLKSKSFYSLEQFIHTLRNKNTPYPEKKENPMNLLQRSLKAVQARLIQSIQNKGIDPELWETYVLMVKEMY